MNIKHFLGLNVHFPTFLLFPPEDTLTATQVAKTFNMTVYDFNAVLRDMGIPPKTATHSEKAL